MLGSADPQDCDELWNSRTFFPKGDKTELQRVQQLAALLNKVTKGVIDWDKDKRTGLFRKTTTGIALGAGADADAVNRHMGWKPDTQSRSYAAADLGAHLHEQAVLAGFDNDAWRQKHHLGRTAVVAVSHGVMPCYLGLQDCQNCQTCQPEDKKSCNAFRNLLRHTGKPCQ